MKNFLLKKYYLSLITFNYFIFLRVNFFFVFVFFLFYMRPLLADSILSSCTYGIKNEFILFFSFSQLKTNNKFFFQELSRLVFDLGVKKYLYIFFVKFRFITFINIFFKHFCCDVFYYFVFFINKTSLKKQISFIFYFFCFSSTLKFRNFIFSTTLQFYSKYRIKKYISKFITS